MGVITPIVSDKIWFEGSYADKLKIWGKTLTFTEMPLDYNNFRILMLFGEDQDVTNRDKIVVRILLNLLEERREGIDVKRSESELAEARRVLRKFLPNELL